jgi:hypothetical protein
VHVADGDDAAVRLKVAQGSIERHNALRLQQRGCEAAAERKPRRYGHGT